MTFPRFFVDRPIFAVVLSVLMLIAGGITLFQLPLSEYPSVTPPTVQVTAAYPGASPEVIAETVAVTLVEPAAIVPVVKLANTGCVTDPAITG